jgi:hypothetical protein
MALYSTRNEASHVTWVQHIGWDHDAYSYNSEDESEFVSAVCGLHVSVYETVCPLIYLDWRRQGNEKMGKRGYGVETLSLINREAHTYISTIVLTQ